MRGEADRYARLYFNHLEKVQMLADAGASVDGAYVVLVSNTYVPIETVPGCAAVLRRRVKGDQLDAAEDETLQQYLSQVNAGWSAIADRLRSGGLDEGLRTLVRNGHAWPAIALAYTEDEMRAILVQQFECICRHRIGWRGVDSDTSDFAIPGGVCVTVHWWWHG